MERVNLGRYRVPGHSGSVEWTRLRQHAMVHGNNRSWSGCRWQRTADVGSLERKDLEDRKCWQSRCARIHHLCSVVSDDHFLHDNHQRLRRANGLRRLADPGQLELRVERFNMDRNCLAHASCWGGLVVMSDLNLLYPACNTQRRHAGVSRRRRPIHMERKGLDQEPDTVARPVGVLCAVLCLAMALRCRRQ